jgi:hypothetical protein
LYFRNRGEVERLIRFVERNFSHLDAMIDALNITNSKIGKPRRKNDRVLMETLESLEDDSFILIVHPKADKYRGTGLSQRRVSLGEKALNSHWKYPGTWYTTALELDLLFHSFNPLPCARFDSTVLAGLA